MIELSIISLLMDSAPVNWCGSFVYRVPSTTDCENPKGDSLNHVLLVVLPAKATITNERITANY